MDDPLEMENVEWLESLDDVLARQGPDRVREILDLLRKHGYSRGVTLPFSANTPYVNSIPADEQSPFPGSREIERRIKSIIRWNAMAMVVRANKAEHGIGGHISSYASSATLLEIAFNHFLRARTENFSGDLVYFQGHASPGIYARAFLEGRLSERDLENFRRELAEGGGLSSYPHPWLMPGFWQFPTVSMGLGPIMAIYHARFNRYLEDRGLLDASRSKVWAFLGDGETDEPESLGAITLASREKLDNLIFVVNCNLQRLDGPVRGNGKIVQELEAAFRGAGWNVVKVVWGSDWDDLLERDRTGLLVRRMDEMCDGEDQKLGSESGAYVREHFFGKYPELLELVAHLTDEHLRRFKRGGHDPEKVYAAYKAAVEHKGAPTVILARTIKGYGLGEAGEGKNITHQQKKLNEDELREFRTRFGIPISDEEVAEAPFYRPAEDSPEMRYLRERREALGGFLPRRVVDVAPLAPPDPELFKEFHEGTGDREVSTTMAMARLLSKLLKDPNVGRLIVPIVPDEARTFGMEALFRQCGIYSHVGQIYEPVDAGHLLYYKEATDGQILEEGITEAGAMASFIAAGTSYANHGVATIPFFAYYSMFGFQRIGDLIWAAADMRVKGFLFGGTAGRTTLNGEGLQHEDGHSHLLAYPVPNLLCYDPAFAYEVSVLIEEGIRRMHVEQDDVFYYMTIYNENYPQPAMPKGSRDGILKGVYLFSKSALRGAKARVGLLGSGPIVNQVLAARDALEGQYGVAADVYSVTSYKALYADALDSARWNRLNPTAKKPRVPYVTQALAASGEGAAFVAATDYVKTLPLSVASWIPGPLVALGTDGFGRSESRSMLRDFFEVDSRHVVVAALAALANQGKIAPDLVAGAIKEFGIDPERANPFGR
jgi:pyruvate dehydrogenase E1 component